MSKIMIADDDQAILDALTIVLEEEGYDVEASLDGRQIINQSGELPDLIILDIWMSGMDGSDICKFLRENRQTRRIPVFLMSAKPDVGAVARQCGADDYFAKPFDIDAVLNKIKRCLAGA